MCKLYSVEETAAKTGVSVSTLNKWRFSWSVVEFPIGVLSEFLGHSVTTAEVSHFSGEPRPQPIAEHPIGFRRRGGGNADKVETQPAGLLLDVTFEVGHGFFMIRRRTCTSQMNNAVLTGVSAQEHATKAMILLANAQRRR